jgi:hypothetical protein
MVGIDRLLVKSLDTIIRENLGDRTIKKIENRLSEKYGISLSQSIEEFQKLDIVLREFFGPSTDGLEKKFLRGVCEIKLVDGENWVLIENPELTKTILESFGDEDKKKILGALNGNSLIVSQILEKCNIPQTSGYRKVNSLIKEGLLVPSGCIVAPDGKKITKYRSIFDNIKIDILKDKIVMTLHLPKEDFSSSSILSVCIQQ